MTTESQPTPVSTEVLLLRVLDRLDALEEKVDRLTPVPQSVSSAVDTVDGLIRSGQARGLDMDDRIAAGAELIERISEPKVAKDLFRLLDRVDVLASTAEQLAEAPRLTAMALDMADAFMRAKQAEGLDPHRSLDGLSALLIGASRPEVLRAMATLLERLPDVAALAEAAPKMVAMMMDSLDELSYRAAQQGLDVDQALRSLLTAGLRITEVLDSPQMKALLSSDVLAPETLEVVGRAGRALTEQSSKACGRAGVFAAFGAIADEDIQRALYFFIGFAQRFGAKMNCEAPG